MYRVDENMKNKKKTNWWYLIFENSKSVIAKLEVECREN